MEHLQIEVADIFRQEGSAHHAESLSRGQCCVMSAIQRCRTACFFGGHVEERGTTAAINALPITVAGIDTALKCQSLVPRAMAG